MVLVLGVSEWHPNRQIPYMLPLKKAGHIEILIYQLPFVLGWEMSLSPKSTASLIFQYFNNPCMFSLSYEWDSL
jgi:hypothetical protein